MIIVLVLNLANILEELDSMECIGGDMGEYCGDVSEY